MDTKDQQDTYLQGLMEIKTIARPRGRLDANDNRAKSKKYSVFYNISSKGHRIPVCKNALLTIFKISTKRLRRISSLLAEGKSPRDMRGKNLKSHAIENEVCDLIRGHISSFPLKSSHYTGTIINYLSADLNLKTMHSLFLEKYPDSQVKYSFYYTFFKENFNYRFGRPQKDVCGTCEDLSTKIKNPVLNDVAKRVAVAEKMIHLRKSKKFYSSLKDVGKRCVDEEDTYGVVIDYMQNLPLPHIPVQEIFYYRQLWVNCFCIYDLKTKTSKIYTYHEGIAKKGANEVCSFLYDYIQKNIPVTAKEIHLFSDGCPGQNKNHTVLRFLLGLSIKRNITIKQYFPTRGHSYLPCDRHFGIIKRRLKREDRVYSPMQYSIMINESSNGKIESILLENNDIVLDFNKWWPKYFKKLVAPTQPLSDKRSTLFKISEYSYFEMRSGELTAFETIKGLVKDNFKLTRPNIRNMDLPKEKAFSGMNVINEKKIGDIKKVLHYVPEEYRNFYDRITSWPTTAEALPSDDEN